VSVTFFPHEQYKLEVTPDNGAKHMITTTTTTTDSSRHSELARDRGIVRERIVHAPVRMSSGSMLGIFLGTMLIIAGFITLRPFAGVGEPGLRTQQIDTSPTLVEPPAAAQVPPVTTSPPASNN
jgi:hypothetical protein